MTDPAEDELERCRERVGSTVRGEWRLDDLIGIGGMAAVYAATHREGRRAAIKILHPEIAISRELRQRFEREAQIIGQLGHAATVQVSEVGETEDGAPFMVMELLDGESLGQRASRLGGIPVEELLGHMATVLGVLGEAHARGIVHRDIKPDNLFITTDAGIKVLDFGIAHMKHSGAGSLRTRTGALLGTTAYMAPEQILGRGGIDGRADLYAVGALMFRILAKRKIHEAASDVEMLMQMGTMPAPSLRVVAPQIPARVSVIVDRALAFDRDQRYPDAARMRHDIEAVLRGQEPPFASLGALASDSPTRAEAAGSAAAPGAAVPAAAAPVATPLGPTRVVERPTDIDPVPPKEPTPARSEAGWARPTPSGSLSRERTHVALPVRMVVVIGALLVIVGGGITALFLVGDCGGGAKKSTAASDEERPGPTRRDTTTSDPSADAGKDEEIGEDEGKGKRKRKGKGRGKGKGKGKGRERGEEKQLDKEEEKERERERERQEEKGHERERDD